MDPQELRKRIAENKNKRTKFAPDYEFISNEHIRQLCYYTSNAHCENPVLGLRQWEFLERMLGRTPFGMFQGSMVAVSVQYCECCNSWIVDSTVHYAPFISHCTDCIFREPRNLHKLQTGLQLDSNRYLWYLWPRESRLAVANFLEQVVFDEPNQILSQQTFRIGAWRILGHSARSKLGIRAGKV